MSEAASWATLRDEIKRQCPKAHVQRFEDKLAVGLPDANLCIDGREAWLEGKHLPAYPKRGASLVKVGLRVEQAVWAENRALAGGIVFCWARVPDGWVLFEQSGRRQEFRRIVEGVPLGLWREQVYVFKKARYIVEEITKRLT